MKIFTLTSLLLWTLFFSACQETTTTAPLTDISSISINETNISLYPTDLTQQATATVLYKDTTTADVTKFVQWLSTDLNLFTAPQGLITVGTINGGDANLSISYKKYLDTKTVHLHKLTKFHILAPDVNSSGTGTYTFEAYGAFDNGESNRSIANNILWNLNGKTVTNVVKGVATITFTTGDANVTATMFNDTNSSSPISPITLKFRVN